MTDGEHEEITLGRVRVPCIAQPHYKISRRLGRHVLALFDSDDDVDADVASIVSRLGGALYDVTCVFYPQLRTGEPHQRMSRWEFDGYATEDAWKGGEDDDDAATVPAPTIPDLITAFTTAVRVNKLDELRRITDVIDPKRVKQYIDARLDLMIAEAGSPSTRTEASPISPSTSGGSGSTSTSAPTPISLASTG